MSTHPSDIGEVSRHLLGGWRRVVAGTAVGVALGAGVPLLLPTEYTATTSLVVVPVADGTNTEAADFGKIFARVAKDPVVLAEAPHLRELRLTPQQAADASLVTASPDAPVLEVQGRASTAFRAAEIANVVGQGIRVHAESRSTDTGFLLRVFVPATPPLDPSAPRPLLSLVVGTMVGLVAGTTLALARRPATTPFDGPPPLPAQGTRDDADRRTPVPA